MFVLFFHVSFLNQLTDFALKHEQKLTSNFDEISVLLPYSKSQKYKELNDDNVKGRDYDHLNCKAPLGTLMKLYLRRLQLNIHKTKSSHVINFNVSLIQLIRRKQTILYRIQIFLSLKHAFYSVHKTVKCIEMYLN